jgi:5-methylcytosine-specific restriction enzyme subunit McrC
MARKVLDLLEEELVRVSRADLNDAEVLALHTSGKFDVEAASVLNGNRYGVRSRGWIGQIPVGDDLLVRVVPKVPVSNLFRMLEVAYNLSSFHLFDGDVEIESLDDIYERVVSILAQRVIDRARKGLHRGYIGESDELPYVRGSIDVLGAILNVTKGIPKVPCHYEDHTADLRDNRILYWTLHQVPRQAIRREKVRSELDRARRALAGSITLERFSAADCIKGFYHRLNDDYRPMHGLCRFILERTGPGIAPADRTFVPFELNMRQLFESFVAEWLRINPPPGMTARYKYTAHLETDSGMKIEIDVLLCDESTQKPVAVLDAKYKANELPSEDDRNQIAFYAAELQVHHGMFVYPSSVTKPFKLLHAKTVNIESLVFDIGKPLDDAGQAFLNALTTSLSSPEV